MAGQSVHPGEAANVILMLLVPFCQRGWLPTAQRIVWFGWRGNSRHTPAAKVNQHCGERFRTDDAEALL